MSYLRIKRALKAPAQELAARFGAHTRNDGARLWVLMYHRILPKADPRYANEEPGMVVEPETFRRHISLLRKFFTITSLQGWLDSHKQGERLPDRACAITFDDGWADNYEYAFPILEAESIPATIFLVADAIGTDRQFWPNRVAALLEYAGASRDCNIDWPVDLADSLAVRASASERASAVVAQLKNLDDAEIERWLDETEQKIEIADATSPALMDWEQVRAMSKSGLVDFGSHTCNHTRLNNQLEEAALEYEIAGSRSKIEHALGKPVKLFCYPNGDYCSNSEELVRQYYDAAVTTTRGINSADSMEPAKILRVGIHQDASSTDRAFLSKLSGWF